MPNIFEIEKVEMPSARNGWKRKVRKQFNWRLFIFLVFAPVVISALLQFILIPLVVPEKAGAVQFKTEKEWEAEICADYREGKYLKDPAFDDFCL